MGQLTIYLPDDVERAVRTAAKKHGKSVSAYLASLARPAPARGKKSEWQKRIDDLGGSWLGPFPELDDPPLEEP
ncbi:MAG: hypothetical protein Q8L14_02255 [Myxococcales bacterium]|nr:hypothetical protein [Myxococcales bacterium]